MIKQYAWPREESIPGKLLPKIGNNMNISENGCGSGFYNRFLRVSLLSEGAFCQQVKSEYADADFVCHDTETE